MLVHLSRKKIDELNSDCMQTSQHGSYPCMMLINMANVERLLATCHAGGIKARKLEVRHHPVCAEIPCFPPVISYETKVALNLGGSERSPLFCS